MVVVLAISESTAVSLSTTLLGAMSGLLLGLIVYVWKTNISGIRKSVEQTNEDVKSTRENLRDLERDKADVSEVEKIVDEMRVEQREGQARYVFLNETLTNALAEMRREFARSSECAQKHATLDQNAQMLVRQMREQKEMLQIIAVKVDQILEWKAYKTGEEHGRAPK